MLDKIMSYLSLNSQHTRRKLLEINAMRLNLIEITVGEKESNFQGKWQEINTMSLNLIEIIVGEKDSNLKTTLAGEKD